MVGVSVALESCLGEAASLRDNRLGVEADIQVIRVQHSNTLRSRLVTRHAL